MPPGADLRFVAGDGGGGQPSGHARQNLQLVRDAAAPGEAGVGQ
jgi:hypothetical protein